MPPNPARQEKMRQRREAYENDPEMQRMQREMGQRVMRDYEGFAGNPEPKTPQPSTPQQPARPAPSFRGGGGSGFKQNTGRKSGLPQVEPDFSIKLYKDGGKVLPGPISRKNGRKY